MSHSGAILVLGASGGIGRYLLNYFRDNQSSFSNEIIGVGRKPNAPRFSGYPYIQADITQKEDFRKLPSDVFAVIDLAGAMPARMAGYFPEQYIDTNIVGTFNVLEYCRKQKVDRILFTQSFGDIKDRAKEEPMLTPFMTPKFDYGTDHSFYIISKNTAVEMLKCYNAMYHMKTFIFRLPTIYSWSSNDSYYVDGVLRKRAWRYLIDRATKGEPIEVWGDASRVKDMVYVKDFCQMLYKASFVERQFGYYNVGTGVGTSMIDQIKGMVSVFGGGNVEVI